MKQYYVGLVGLIERAGKILVLKKSSHSKFEPNTWEIVTGHLEFEEQPETGIIRTIEESTNIEATIKLTLSSGFFYRGKDFPMVYIAFWCQYQKGDISLNSTHSEAKWITIEEALSEPTLGHYHDLFKRLNKIREFFPEGFII